MTRSKAKGRKNSMKRGNQSATDTRRLPLDEVRKLTDPAIPAHETKKFGQLSSTPKPEVKEDTVATAMTQIEPSRKRGSQKRAVQFAMNKGKLDKDEVGALTDEAIAAHDAKTLEELGSMPGLGLKEDPLFSVDDGDKNLERGERPDGESDVEDPEDYGDFYLDETGTYDEHECIDESDKISAPKVESAMEICGETDRMHSVEQEIKGEDAISGLGGGMDIVDLSGVRNAKGEENKSRLWRARKRLREVAGLYWNWGQSTDNTVEEQKEALKLVNENKSVKRKCELCGIWNFGALNIDNHQQSQKHDKMYGKYFLEMILPPRTPDVLERRKENEMHRKVVAQAAELKRLARHSADGAQKRKLDAEKVSPVKKQKLDSVTANPPQKRKVAKSCDVCSRDFVMIEGYEGHLKGKKHIAAVARAEAKKDHVKGTEATSSRMNAGKGNSSAKTAGKSTQIDGNKEMMGDILSTATKANTGNKASTSLNGAKASAGNDGLVAVNVAKTDSEAVIASGTGASSVGDLVAVKASTCNDDFVE